MKGFQPTPHPVLALPTPGMAVALGEQKWREVMARREQIIRDERNDPFGQCWEPPIWRVCDALLGFPWVEPVWAERMRTHLKFDRPARVLLINGGQRGGKSQYAGNRVMRILRLKEAARAWALHSTMPMSRDYQQPIFFNYLPKQLREADVKSRTTYVAYKQKTGFSEEKFVLPNLSDLLFKTYDQDVHSIEGGNLDIIWPDELVPVDWVRTMELRIAEKDGWMILTFTPVAGYTETVKEFQDGAEVVQDSVAFLSPKDGGPPDEARALGLTEEQFAEIKLAAEEKRASYYPQSVPEDCGRWLDAGSPARRFADSGETGSRGTGETGSRGTGETGSGRNGETGKRGNGAQPEIPPGREFERVPRVMKCVHPEGKRAVVFFHSSDNPYGNPKSVLSVLSGKAQEFVQERFYGVAHKTFSARFPKFNLKVHVVEPSEIPREGSNYQFSDPASGRNMFMVWFRVTPEHAYAYREFPGPYYLEGIGAPGPWALPDGKKLDGRPGPAQNTFGWGYRDYKKLIATVEGWKEAGNVEDEGNGETASGRNGASADSPAHRFSGSSSAGSADSPAHRFSGSSSTSVDEWDERNGAREEIQERFMDSRFASAPRMERDRPTTLLTDFEDLLLFFTPTPGGPIAEGVAKINDLLRYDESKAVDFFNKPYLLISRECPNLIFALQTWTGRDGEKGATKDPIDCLHYFATADCGYLGGGEEPETRTWSDTKEGSYY